MNTTWVVIAAYNEERRLSRVLERVKNHAQHIVVVDDGSKDKTAAIAKKHNVILLEHDANRGKGAAARTGCDYALEHGAQQIILLDADGQHEPQDIPRFLDALEGNDIVFSYRTYDKHMPFVYRFGNSVINLATGMLFGIWLRDTQSGYRAMTADAYRNVRWYAERYFMESEMIARAGAHRLRFTQIPIKTIYLDRRKGTTVLDGILIVWRMILLRFSRLR